VKKKRKPRPRVQGIVGLGLDNTDGHKRITTGDKFAIVGGSGSGKSVLLRSIVGLMRRLDSDQR